MARVEALSDGHWPSVLALPVRKAVGVDVGLIRTGSNLVQVKSRNLSVVFDAIRQFGFISRTELTEHTHLTPSTISNLVNELLEHHLLFEAGSSASQGGRKRTLLTLNNQACWVIALSTGPSRVQGALVDIPGTMGCRYEEHVSDSTVECIQQACHTVTSHLMQTAHSLAQKVVGIGLAAHRQEVEGAPWWLQWYPDVSLPFYAEHSVRAAALGETWLGAGKGHNSLVYLTYSSEPEVGVVVNRTLFCGAHGQAALEGMWNRGRQKQQTWQTMVDTVSSAYDPDVIVMGDPAGTTPCLDAPASTYGVPHVLPSQLGKDAALLGAACLVLEAFFLDPLGFLARANESSAQLGVVGA